MPEFFHRLSEKCVQGCRDISRWFGKEAGGQTDYADRQTGMWAGLLGSDARFWLTRVQQKLSKLEPDKFAVVENEPSVTYVIDRAEELDLCSQDMICYLRQEFVHDNGLPFVLNLKPAED